MAANSERLEPKSEKVSSLDDVLADSARKIGAEPQAAPIKRGRGRPRKNPLPGEQAPVSIQDLNGLDQAPAPAPVDFNIPHPELAPYLQIPCRIIAEARQFDGYKMPDDVALSLSGPLHGVLQKYFPAMSGEQSALVMLGMGVGGFFIAAYLAERDHKRELAKKPAAPSSADPADQVSRPFPVISAT